MSLFDVIGPNMIGPSSSHTAGAASIGLFVSKMFARPIKKAVFTLYGSFAQTYQGHGTDRALLGGVLGFETDDPRIRDAFTIAEERGIAYEFIADEKTATVHPNTADILLEDPDGYTLLDSRRIDRRRKNADRADQPDRGSVYRGIQYVDLRAEGCAGRDHAYFFMSERI